jgi:beta-lactamase class A
MVLLTILVVTLTGSAWSADIAALRSQIEKILPRMRGQVGVAIKHAESGTELMINADQTYPMASTYKVPILVELFYQNRRRKTGVERSRRSAADRRSSGRHHRLAVGRARASDERSQSH